MSLITSNEVLLRVNKLLNDKGFIKWTKDELLDYLNDAQKAIVLRRPDAYTEDDDEFVCVAGTKQTLPGEALQLIEIPRGFTGRSIIGPLDHKTLDENYPDWHTGNTATEADHYIYNPKNPKVFYLYPGVVAGTKVNVIFSKSPVTITMAQNDAAALIALDDIYFNAIIEWIMYRCYMKDAEYAADPNKSNGHLTAFRVQLGDKVQADSAIQAKAE